MPLPKASSCFFRSTFKSTTGILDKASFAALITEALTLSPLSPPLSASPNKSSSSAAGFVMTVFIPLEALISAAYSHDRSWSSRE